MENKDIIQTFINRFDYEWGKYSKMKGAILCMNYYVEVYLIKSVM